VSAAELLAELTARGVRLTACGDRLAYDAPAGVMTAELRDRVKACKPELLAMLAGNPEPAPDARPETHADREWRRFLAVCRPWPDGRGWYDPRELERFRRLTERPAARPEAVQAHALEETAVERAARYRAEAKPRTVTIGSADA